MAVVEATGAERLSPTRHLATRSDFQLTAPLSAFRVVSSTADTSLMTGSCRTATATARSAARDLDPVT